MITTYRFCIILFVGLVLAACSASEPEAAVEPTQATATQPVQLQTETGTPASKGLLRSDGQGAVTVEVTPLNLETPEETLDFEVGLNTHSVDLSMDLSTLASLTTDMGRTVQAANWDAPPGGHHVSGTLSFPSSYDGARLLEGANQITLTIEDLDAPLRLFNWRLSE